MEVSNFETHTHISMILPTYPGKIPQTSPNPHKERNSFINCWWNFRGIFQGYVGEILEYWVNWRRIEKRPENKSSGRNGCIYIYMCVFWDLVFGRFWMYTKLLKPGPNLFDVIVIIVFLHYIIPRKFNSSPLKSCKRPQFVKVVFQPRHLKRNKWHWHVSKSGESHKEIS